MASRLAKGVATTEKAPFKAQAQGMRLLSRGRRLRPRGKKKPMGIEARAAQAPRKTHLAGRGQERNAPKTPSSRPRLSRNQISKAIAAGRKPSFGCFRKLPESQLPKPEKISMAQRTREKAIVRSPRK